VAEADAPMLARRPATGPLETMDLIRERTVEAVLGRSGLNHRALAAEIRRRFGSRDVAEGALVREPVIEGAAAFEVEGRTFTDCAGTLLHPKVISAISSEGAGDYRFPPDAQPYRHQIAAWEHLTAPDRRSVLVSSGTGSGKTECFLMPLLHDLATEAEQVGRLRGVRAIALYPLNALIASQEERLRAWTAPFGDTLRFGLYNGLTQERLRAQDKRRPEQVLDRQTLRSDPPPILVTNVAMLEYMLVRRIDRPLIEKSQGTLRWIILDEAHSYVGSSAAEIALLLRRVLLTFGVTADQVRFVATSATIGGEGVDVTDELRRFLRDISGAEERQVHVVLGKREQVLLPAPAASPALAVEDLQNRDRVAASPAVQAFIREAERKPVPLAKAAQLLKGTAQPLDAVIEAIANDQDRQRGPLLPLRVHGFLRAVPGLWSCMNPACGGQPDGWPYGAISPERTDSCPSCQAPVLEIMTCGECGEPYLDCEERDGKLQQTYTPPVLDEFAVLRERELADDNDAEDEDGDGNSGGAKDAPDYAAIRLSIGMRRMSGARDAHVEPLTGVRHDHAAPSTFSYPVYQTESCGACSASATPKRAKVLRPLRFGAPYLIGNAAPVLLEGVEPRKLDAPGAYRAPADGRQLLSFTDSRQGSARFAANLQTTSERAFVRGVIYHAVQGSMVAATDDDPEIESLRNDIAKFEGWLQQFGESAPPDMKDMLEASRAKLAQKLQPDLRGIPWTELRKNLAALPEVHHWMAKVWGPREDRYNKQHGDFAEFLLLREFNRRPKNGNTPETMGLARLRFDVIDKATAVPPELLAKGKNINDWRNLLYVMIDAVVRGQAAIRASWDDMHWLGSRRPLYKLLPPGEKAQARTDVAWPQIYKPGGLPSNLIHILEKALQLDHDKGEDRRDINSILEAAWFALRPILSSPQQPGYALDFDKAWLAPVMEAWLCPVTRQVLPATALGYSPYGHRDGLKMADMAAPALAFPRLPVSFPDAEGLIAIRSWLSADEQVQSLRDAGIWTNLHDRVALLSPYLRAAEHSAQQPANRLRRFENEFKAGEINILNCSTTMEMGVDIGSVSAVMMTNVPPSLASYRQRVGRAGRRRQGFASSLTYTRDTPLDREAFRDPTAYLGRPTRAPQVRLDSRRIVQRHINALLLARWFASAGGEALKTRAGDFFGCPEIAGAAYVEQSPLRECIDWMQALSTWQEVGNDVFRLAAGTILDRDQSLLAAAATILEDVARDFETEWKQLQAQIASADVQEGRASLEYQLKRLTRENLLKELVVRGYLPGHGMPTAVVPFVHEDKPGQDTADGKDDQDEGNQRRRSYPSRTLDIAIRDYAPGSEVVVNGLVYRSAGVTLNWQRPADDAQAREVQSLRYFWSCPSCGAADCAPVAPDFCPSCREQLPLEARKRFLEPSGFLVDMAEKPHADTDQVRYVEPEPEQIVARNTAWQDLVAPHLGRMRASADGLVLFSSKGVGHQGYHVCLECGRAEPASAVAKGSKPLDDHRPLRGTRRNGAGLCPGNEKSFKITAPLALGYEAATDVAELQPVGLEQEGAAWAVVSALREALGRRLGVETGELGIAVRSARGLMGQKTHSLFLFDRAAGGAGFAPNVVRLFEDVLQDAARILDCSEPGCTKGCSACVLTGDLFRHQESIDRKAALQWARTTLEALGSVDKAEMAAPDARYCPSVADALAEAVEAGAQTITVWAGPDTDIASVGSGLFEATARKINAMGKHVRLVVEQAWLDQLDAAARLALRDASKALLLDLRIGKASTYPNGAVAIAQADGPRPLAWVSRDPLARNLSEAWGHTGIRITPGTAPLTAAVVLDGLLPVSGTRYIEITRELDGDLLGFGKRFAGMLASHIRAVGGIGPIERITYNDRYLQTPMSVRLLAAAIDGLHKTFGAEGALKVDVITNPLRPNERQPFALDHDWQFAEDRDEVLLGLLAGHGFTASLDDRNAAHGRVMTLEFSQKQVVRIILDQGFGPWRAPSFARFDFGVDTAKQLAKLAQLNAIVSARGPGYMVITTPF
jgi:DEAD/DEAH box helicase domain-containing protein